MAKKPEPMQVIEVKDYGHDWVNRLAVVLSTLDKMEERERSATFSFLKSKYAKDWPSDNY